MRDGWVRGKVAKTHDQMLYGPNLSRDEKVRRLCESWWFEDQAGHIHAYGVSGFGLTLPSLVNKRPDTVQDEQRPEVSYPVPPDWRCKECSEPVDPLTRRGAEAIVEFCAREGIDFFGDTRG